VQSDAAAIVQAVKAYRFHYSNEKELQEAVAKALGAGGIPYEREKVLPEDYGTIDFLVAGRIGVEIKIKGSPSAVTRQLLRYLKCGEIQELVLVTGRAKLGNLPREILGKRLTVVTLWETFL
jgi:hypothetical protein